MRVHACVYVCVCVCVETLAMNSDSHMSVRLSCCVASASQTHMGSLVFKKRH